MPSPDGVPEERYSFSREWFATQPPKVKRLAYERRDRDLRIDRWPHVSVVKTAYHRRTRRRRSR